MERLEQEEHVTEHAAELPNGMTASKQSPSYIYGEESRSYDQEEHIHNDLRCQSEYQEDFRRMGYHLKNKWS